MRESQLTYICLQYKPTGQQNVGCLKQRSISFEDRKHQKAPTLENKDDDDSFSYIRFVASSAEVISES
jgi:hypothetical protein